jgi:hypothetical protein
MYFCGFNVLSDGLNWEDFTLYQYLGSFWSKFGYLTPNLTSVTLEIRSKTFFSIFLIELVHIMGGWFNNLMPKYAS